MSYPIFVYVNYCLYEIIVEQGFNKHKMLWFYLLTPLYFQSD